MKIIKENIALEDKSYAVDILNKLRAGDRTFGAPAEGLKIQLKELEKNKPKENSFNDINYNLDDSDYAGQVAKLKAGIKGEEELSQYFEKVIRLDKELSDIIVFASLGDVESDKDYIPDTDFLCVYGSNILTIDAKNIKTKPDIPLFVSGNGIYSALNHDEPILEVNPSVPVWKKILSQEYHGNIESIHGCVCVINKTGTMVMQDEDWWRSEIKPIHISGLVDYLHTWIEGKVPSVDLNLLVTIMKKQIYKPKSDMDLTMGKRIFGV